MTTYVVERRRNPDICVKILLSDRPVLLGMMMSSCVRECRPISCIKLGLSLSKVLIEGGT